MAAGYQTSLVTDLSEDVAMVLAIVYKAIDWKKKKGIKNTHDWFAHWVQVSNCNEDFPKFLNKLSEGVGLQAIPQDTLPYVERICQKDEEAMTLLRTEPKIMVLSFNLTLI